MYQHRIAGNLKRVKGKIQEEWGWRTHRYSHVVSGKITQIVGKLQSIYGRIVR